MWAAAVPELQAGARRRTGMREAQHRLNLPENFRRCECRNNVIKPTLASADGRGEVKCSAVKQTTQVVRGGLPSEGSQMLLGAERWKFLPWSWCWPGAAVNRGHPARCFSERFHRDDLEPL